MCKIWNNPKNVGYAGTFKKNKNPSISSESQDQLLSCASKSSFPPGYVVTFCSQWLNYAIKPAKTSAKIRCQAHKACYWQYPSSGSQVPS